MVHRDRFPWLIITNKKTKREKKMKNILKGLFLLLCSMLFGIQMAKADNTLAIGDLEAKAGETVVLPITMTNTDDIIAFQFSIALPEGITIKQAKNEDDELEYCVTLTDRAKSKHIISCGDPVNGVYTAASFSSTNQTYRDNGGTICEIQLVIAPEMKAGKYDIALTGIELTNVENQAINPSDSKATCTVSTGASGVKDVKSVTNTKTYDLSGRQVTGNKSQKGIVIRNGKVFRKF